MEDPKKAEWTVAALVVRIAGAWILAGALFKLLAGTPADLPELVKKVPLALGLTWKLAIGVELSLAALALLRPRWAWPLLLLTFLVFDAVLASQVAAGAKNCGCFGSSVQVPPWLMLTIDSVLLAGLLITRPWRLAATGPSPLVSGALLASIGVGVALPWIHDREVGGTGSDGASHSPDGGFVIFDVESWIGEDVADTPLGSLLDDPYALPPDGLWVLYRQDCEHCAEHLAELARTEQGDRFIVLVRLKQSHDTEASRVVYQVPAGPFVQSVALPDTVHYVVTTPAELELEGYRILAAAEGVSSD